MTELTDEEAKALLAECDNPDCLTCEYARALLDARAELARVKADAAVAVAEAIRRAAENKEQLDIWAQEILEGLSFADVLKITSYDDKIEAHNIVGRGLVDVILNLAPADALAEVQRLRVEARENAMQALASMGQAQEAYEAQLEAEAELARTVIALHAQLADAQAAQAMVVERCAEFVERQGTWMQEHNLVGNGYDLVQQGKCLRALAPIDGFALVQELRAGVERLNRWRAEEGEKIKRQAKALTDLTKHCQRIEAENAGLARKIGKVQRGDGDHSQIADLEAKVINQRNELRALQAQSTPPISPEEAQFNAVRHHERFGPLDEKGNPVDPRRRG